MPDAATPDTDTMEHTPAPWSLEVQPHHKRVNIMSETPMRPIVMRLKRWGVQGAQLQLPGERVLQDMTDFMKPAEGREHHANWHQIVDHPNVRRLLACVNFCEGTPTDALEIMLEAGDLVPDLIEREQALTERVEKLETALRDALSWLGNMPPADPRDNRDAIGDVVRRGREALATEDTEAPDA